MATFLTYNSLLDDMSVYAERAFTVASDPLVFAQRPRLINLAERRCATELKVQGFLKNVVGTFTVGVDTYDKPDRWREWVSFNSGNSEVFNTVSRQAAAGVRTIFLNRPHPFTVGQTLQIDGLGGVGYNGAFALTAVTQLSVTYTNGATTEGVTLDIAGFVSLPMKTRKPVLPRVYEYVRGYGNGTLSGFPLYYADYDYYHFLATPTPDRPYPFELNYYELPPLLDLANQTNWLTDIAPNMLLYASLLEMAPFLKNAEMTQTWQMMYDRSAQAVTGQDLDKIHDRTSERTKP